MIFEFVFFLGSLTGYFLALTALLLTHKIKRRIKHRNNKKNTKTHPTQHRKI